MGHSTCSSLSLTADVVSQSGKLHQCVYTPGDRSSLTGPPINSSSSGGSDVTASTVLLGTSGNSSSAASVSG